MIPKIIHYVWIGGKNIPSRYQKYINHWKVLLPEWTFKRWDETNFNIETSEFLKRAYARKKWAFASDYIRLKVLYEYGGIYLDTDEELLQSLDEFLCYDAFWGLEPGLRMQAGVFGCSKKNPILGKILDYYEKMDFNDEMVANQLVIGDHIYNVLKREFPFLSLREEIIKLPGNMAIFPSHYFCPDLATLVIDKYSYTIHHPMGSWLPYHAKIKIRLYIMLVSNKILRAVYKKLKRE